MIIFSGRRVHRHLVTAMNRELGDSRLTDEQKTYIREALFSHPDMEILARQVAHLAKKHNAPDPGNPGDPSPVPVPADHPFLTWIMTVFIPEILPLILALFGL